MKFQEFVYTNRGTNIIFIHIPDMHKCTGSKFPPFLNLSHNIREIYKVNTKYTVVFFSGEFQGALQWSISGYFRRYNHQLQNYVCNVIYTQTSASDSIIF